MFGDNPRIRREIRSRRDHWYDQVARQQYNLVTFVEKVAQAYTFPVERRHVSGNRQDEIDVMAGGIFFGPGIGGFTGFSVHPCPDPAPEWRVREVVHRLQAVVRTPNTAIGDVVIVTSDNTRVRKENGETTGSLYHNNEVIWLAVYSSGAARPIRFESEFTLNRYFEYQIERRELDRRQRK